MAAAFALLLWPTTAFAQDISAKVTFDLPNRKSTVRLSDSFSVTLTAEGPAPIQVQVPDPVLDAVSNRDWRITPVGAAEVKVIAPGREQWSRVFRLSPYVTGDSLDVIFAPLIVNNRMVSVGGFSISVITTVPEANAEAARPITGIETLPDPPPVTPPVHGWQWILAGVVAGIGVAAMLAWRWRRRPVAPDAREAALAALDRLESETPDRAEQLERAAGILRTFIEQRHGIPATRFTTTELLTATREQADVGAIEEADALARILDRCDRAKFAGDIPDDNGCRSLVAACRDWLNQQRAACTGPG